MGGYREYLKVPESWQRSYERLRSGNLTAQTIDTGLLMLLAVALLVTILLRVRTHDVRWRRAAAVGGIAAVLLFFSNWNSQPLAEFNYPTTDSYGSFVAQMFLRNLMGALAAAGLVFVLTAGAEPLYRQYYGGQLSLGNVFSARGLRTRKFLLGAVLGLTLAGIFVAYQTGFYMVAYRFGAWSPADVPYDDLLNTRFPWLFVLFGGFLPAVSEEFLFRMFAIPFLSKLLRSVGIAVVVAGFVWGFGHAGYPQQPFWIRGVEVGIGGVALGLIMLRWGILPTLVWHYSVDAMYSALLLLRSHNPYFVFSGAASAGILVLPVLVALIAYLRHGGFAPETGLTNADEGSSEGAVVESAPREEAPALPSSGWSARQRLAAALIVVVAAILLATLKVREFGDTPRFALRPDAARTIAEQFARSRGFPVQGYREVTYPASRWDNENTRLAAKYIVERRDIGFADGQFRRDAPLHNWAVRFFKPLSREELIVSVDPESGRIIAFRHVLPEDQAGADLAADAARQIAVDFLGSRGIDPTAPGAEGIHLRQEESAARLRAGVGSAARRSAKCGGRAFPHSNGNCRRSRYLAGPFVENTGELRARPFPAQCARQRPAGGAHCRDGGLARSGHLVIAGRHAQARVSLGPGVAHSTCAGGDCGGRYGRAAPAIVEQLRYGCSAASRSKRLRLTGLVIAGLGFSWRWPAPRR